MVAASESVLEFWFGDGSESPETAAERRLRWFQADPAFDDAIRRRFGDLPSSALRGGLDAWKLEARSSLALVLVLDQFPRNIFRGTAESFAYDSLAGDVTAAALSRGFDDELSPIEATFLYLPLEHAEDLESQDRCVSLFGKLLDRVPDEERPLFEATLTFAVSHREIIARFGRFPHRNAVLGRPSSDEETAYLDAGGETFSGTTESG